MEMCNVYHELFREVGDGLLVDLSGFRDPKEFGRTSYVDIK